MDKIIKAAENQVHMTERLHDVPLSLEDLEQFRAKDGFLDLSSLNLPFTKENREERGNKDRLKGWFKFGNTRALIKEELLVDDKKNYSIYAELIAEEIAKQIGVPAAHYDLVRINGKTGVLSVDIRNDYEHEDIISLRELVGDEPLAQSPDIFTTTYSYTEEGLRTFFEEQTDMSDEQIEALITDYRKRTALSLMMLDSDKHTENFSFIRHTGDDGSTQPSYTIAPLYDSESSLLLDSSVELAPDILTNYVTLTETVRVAQPRIAEQGLNNDYYLDTLDYISYDNQEVYDYIMNTLNLIDIEDAISKVEERIHAKLPEEVKGLAKYAFMHNQNRTRKYLVEIGRPLDVDELDDMMEQSISSSANDGLQRLQSFLELSIKKRQIGTDEFKETTDKFLDDVAKFRDSKKTNKSQETDEFDDR